jgi:hypothetical protein
MRLKNKLLIALTLAFLTSLPAFAVETSLKEITGKVEVKLPGKAWQVGKVGMAITKGTTISTGFKSVAVFSIGKTIVTCRPLTRLTIEEIIEKQDTVGAECYLQVGKMRAEVDKPEGGKVDFTVKSPVATASVRGTVFEFDGLNLDVERGTVVYGISGALVRSFTAGEGTGIDARGQPLSAKEDAENKIAVPSSTNPIVVPPTVNEAGGAESESKTGAVLIDAS